MLDLRPKRWVIALLAVCMSSGSVEWNQIPFLKSTLLSPCRNPMSHQKSSFSNRLLSTVGIFVVFFQLIVPLLVGYCLDGTKTILSERLGQISPRYLVIIA